MNSPAKSIMFGLAVTQNPAPSTPITMVTNNIPAKSQIAPPMNLSNNSNSSIPALVDPTKITSSDPPKATSSNSVLSTNSSPTLSPSKTNSNISHDTKPSSNDLSNSTPLVKNSNADVQDTGKDSIKNLNANVGKGTTNGVDITTREVSTTSPEEKILPSTKDHEEGLKVPPLTDSKSSTLDSFVTTATLEPTALTPANVVPPTETADATKSTEESVPSTGSIASQEDLIPEKKSSTPSLEKGINQPIVQSSKEVIQAKQSVEETLSSKSNDILTPTPLIDPSLNTSAEKLEAPTIPKKQQTKITPKKKEDVKVEKTPSNSEDVKVEKTPSNLEVGKTKRTRLPVQPFQSPLPELSFVTRLINKTNSEKVEEKEKLVIFYKNEFLAVRNEDGGFYVCQALQNVFKSSHRIRIRWLSQGTNNEFTPDFYDATEFDCILTCLKLTKIDKEKWKLNEQEKERVENILKRSLEVEKGKAIPTLTEEHPDGLDLSLFRDESQLRKSNKKSSKKSPAKKIPTTLASSTASSKKKEPTVLSTSSADVAKRSLRRPKRIGAKISYDFDEPSSSGSEFSVKTATKKGGAAKVAKTPVPTKKIASAPDIVASKKKAANKSPAAKKTPTTKENTLTPSVSKTKLVNKNPPPPNPSSLSSSKQASKRKATGKTPNTTAAKLMKVEAPPKPKTTSSSERSTKARNAGSAVEAKITSAVTPSRPARERRFGGTTKK